MPEVIRWLEYTYRVELRGHPTQHIRAQILSEIGSFGDVLDHWRFEITSDPVKASPHLVAVIPKREVMIIQVMKTHRVIHNDGQTWDEDA